MQFTIFKRHSSLGRYPSFYNMPSCQVMTSSTQLNFYKIWWRKISQAICITNVWFCSRITPQYKLSSLVTMTTCWIPDLPIIKGFSGHLWRFILIFANGTSYAWSSKHTNMLARVRGLVSCFFELTITKFWNQVGGDWQRMSCHRKRIFLQP